VSATASDDSGVVVGAQLLVDGIPVGPPTMASPWSFTLDTAQFANGSHSLSATAWDASRNVGSSAPVQVAFSNASAGNPAQTGVWSGTLPLPIVTVHQSLLPDGRLLMSDGQSFGSDARLWDTVTNTFFGVPVPSNMFCSGHEQLADGRILVTGGHVGAHIGLTFAGAFDPVSQSWTVLSDMSNQRWYPTATTLSDGRELVLSGESTCAACDVATPEIYNPATNAWTQLTSSPFTFPYYPHVFLLPDKRVLVSSTAEAPIVSQILDLASGTWTAVGGPAVDGATAAMYLPGKIVKSGTSCDPDQASRNAAATTYVLDTTQPAPAWRQVGSMSNPRTFHTMTLLPDGTVLATGGGPTTAATDTARAILSAELWSPATETWTTLATMHAPRLYHSEAMLLADGRVVVSGGGRFDDATLPTDQFSAEFFSPPYLFKGSRPAIASAPTVIQYGGTFTVQTPDAASIVKVSLLRYGSVTHAINMGQRFVPLSFTAAAGTLTVTGPPDGGTAPPGNYFLFIVNGNGVPSLAAAVRI